MTHNENDESIFPVQENLTQPTEKNSYEEKTAGFWMRFWAFSFDTLIVSAIVGILVNPIFHLFNWSLSESNWYAPMTIVSGLIYYIYFGITTKFWQQTIGKMIFGLKVKTVNGEKLDWMTLLFREVIGRFINNTIPILYILAAFMPKNQSIQDIVADTVVVHEKIYKKSENNKTNTYVEDVKTDDSTAPSV